MESDDDDSEHSWRRSFQKNNWINDDDEEMSVPSSLLSKSPTPELTNEYSPKSDIRSSREVNQGLLEELGLMTSGEEYNRDSSDDEIRVLKSDEVSKPPTPDIITIVDESDSDEDKAADILRNIKLKKTQQNSPDAITCQSENVQSQSEAGNADKTTKTNDGDDEICEIVGYRESPQDVVRTPSTCGGRLAIRRLQSIEAEQLTGIDSGVSSDYEEVNSVRNSAQDRDSSSDEETRLVIDLRSQESVKNKSATITHDRKKSNCVERRKEPSDLKINRSGSYEKTDTQRIKPNYSSTHDYHRRGSDKPDRVKETSNDNARERFNHSATSDHYRSTSKTDRPKRTSIDDSSRKQQAKHISDVNRSNKNNHKKVPGKTKYLADLPKTYTCIQTQNKTKLKIVSAYDKRRASGSSENADRNTTLASNVKSNRPHIDAQGSGHKSKYAVEDNNKRIHERNNSEDRTHNTVTKSPVENSHKKSEPNHRKRHSSRDKSKPRSDHKAIREQTKREKRKKHKKKEKDRDKNRKRRTDEYYKNKGSESIPVSHAKPEMTNSTDHDLRTSQPLQKSNAATQTDLRETVKETKTNSERSKNNSENTTLHTARPIINLRDIGANNEKTLKSNARTVVQKPKSNNHVTEDLTTAIDNQSKLDEATIKDMLKMNIVFDSVPHENTAIEVTNSTAPQKEQSSNTSLEVPANLGKLSDQSSQTTSDLEKNETIRENKTPPENGTNCSISEETGNKGFALDETNASKISEPPLLNVTLVEGGNKIVTIGNSSVVIPNALLKSSNKSTTGEGMALQGTGLKGTTARRNRVKQTATRRKEACGVNDTRSTIILLCVIFKGAHAKKMAIDALRDAVFVKQSATKLFKMVGFLLSESGDMRRVIQGISAETTVKPEIVESVIDFCLALYDKKPVDLLKWHVSSEQSTSISENLADNSSECSKINCRDDINSIDKNTPRRLEDSKADKAVANVPFELMNVTLDDIRDDADFSLLENAIQLTGTVDETQENNIIMNLLEPSETNKNGTDGVEIRSVTQCTQQNDIIRHVAGFGRSEMVQNASLSNTAFTENPALTTCSGDPSINSSAANCHKRKTPPQIQNNFTSSSGEDRNAKRRPAFTMDNWLSKTVSEDQNNEPGYASTMEAPAITTESTMRKDDGFIHPSALPARPRARRNKSGPNSMKAPLTENPTLQTQQQNSQTANKPPAKWIGTPRPNLDYKPDFNQVSKFKYAPFMSADDDSDDVSPTEESTTIRAPPSIQQPSHSAQYNLKTKPNMMNHKETVTVSNPFERSVHLHENNVHRSQTNQNVKFQAQSASDNMNNSTNVIGYPQTNVRFPTDAFGVQKTTQQQIQRGPINAILSSNSQIQRVQDSAIQRIEQMQMFQPTVPQLYALRPVLRNSIQQRTNPVTQASFGPNNLSQHSVTVSQNMQNSYQGGSLVLIGRDASNIQPVSIMVSHADRNVVQSSAAIRPQHQQLLTANPTQEVGFNYPQQASNFLQSRNFTQSQVVTDASLQTRNMYPQQASSYPRQVPSGALQQNNPHNNGNYSAASSNTNQRISLNPISNGQSTYSQNPQHCQQNVNTGSTAMTALTVQRNTAIFDALQAVQKEVAAKADMLIPVQTSVQSISSTPVHHIANSAHFDAMQPDRRNSGLILALQPVQKTVSARTDTLVPVQTSVQSIGSTQVHHNANSAHFNAVQPDQSALFKPTFVPAQGSTSSTNSTQTDTTHTALVNGTQPVQSATLFKSTFVSAQSSTSSTNFTQALVGTQPVQNAASTSRPAIVSFQISGPVIKPKTTEKREKEIGINSKTTEQKARETDEEYRKWLERKERSSNNPEHSIGRNMNNRAESSIVPLNPDKVLSRQQAASVVAGPSGTVCGASVTVVNYQAVNVTDRIPNSNMAVNDDRVHPKALQSPEKAQSSATVRNNSQRPNPDSLPCLSDFEKETAYSKKRHKELNSSLPNKRRVMEDNVQLPKPRKNTINHYVPPPPPGPRDKTAILNSKKAQRMSNIEKSRRVEELASNFKGKK